MLILDLVKVIDVHDRFWYEKPPKSAGIVVACIGQHFVAKSEPIINQQNVALIEEIAT